MTYTRKTFDQPEVWRAYKGLAQLISVCASTRDARRRMHTYRLLDPESKFYMRTRRLPIECGQAIDDHIALSSKASD